jgi:hypothetical protein
MVGLLVWFCVMGLVMAAIARLAVTSRRSGHRSSFGVFEEMYHPSAHESYLEQLAEDEREVPRPIPGDPPDLPYDGRAGAIARAADSRRPRSRSRLRALFRRMIR